MRIENDPKLDFKDVLIRPKRSTLSSRAEVDITRTLRFMHTGRSWTGFPLIAANMDVTGSIGMAAALGRHGAMVALHKHYPAEVLVGLLQRPGFGQHVFYTVGTAEADWEKLAVVKRGAPVRFPVHRRRQRLHREVRRDGGEGPRREPGRGDHGRQRRHRGHDGGADPGGRRHRQGRHRPGLGLHHPQDDGRRLPAALRR